MRKLLSGLVCALVAATTITSAQQPIFTPFGILPVLDVYLEALRQQAGIPGMSAAIARDGVVLWEKGYGFQNIATRERATPATPYLVGEVSGTLAAVLLLQCVEQRRLELDAPLGRYGIDIPEATATLRDLLSHRQTEAQGEPFFYNPDRYAQLTTVMEWCAPQPYRKSVSHRILNRLAMIDSVPGTDLRDPELPLPEGLYEPSELERYRRVLGRMAPGYRVESRSRAERTEMPIMTMSARGGLVSTVRDLAKLDGALDTNVLLLQETLAYAWQPALGYRGTPIPSGLGWFVQSYNGHRIVWQFGLVPDAYSSLIIKLPERNLTFILLANSDRLVAPFQLPAGDVGRSLFATIFLKLVT
ncbi:MAG TPA: serine hydrolase domain-containing protein [Vicinamibacterales bacterium]|nr:serine hydrolase domain-containing protein [Vicinamibacterales bacterium]